MYSGHILKPAILFYLPGNQNRPSCLEQETLCLPHWGSKFQIKGPGNQDRSPGFQHKLQ
jgi:hypothetical protein